MQKYYNLKYAFNNCFSYELEADRNTCIKWLKEAIENNEINIEELRKEAKLFFRETDLSILEFAYENKLIEDTNSFSKGDVKQLTLYGIDDIIFPEKVKSFEDIQHFLDAAIQILENYTENGGWLLRKNLYEKLLNIDKFKYYDEYYLFDIVMKSNYMVDIRFEFGKGEQTVYLRYRK